jgi:hypothetical protein
VADLRPRAGGAVAKVSRRGTLYPETRGIEVAIDGLKYSGFYIVATGIGISHPVMITPPCLVQNEQAHARAVICAGSGCQSSAKAMLPQWQLPSMSMMDSWCRSSGSIFQT